jgi:hypothetical protein
MNPVNLLLLLISRNKIAKIHLVNTSRPTDTENVRLRGIARTAKTQIEALQSQLRREQEKLEQVEYASDQSRITINTKQQTIDYQTSTHAFPNLFSPLLPLHLSTHSTITSPNTLIILIIIIIITTITIAILNTCNNNNNKNR